MEKARIGTPPHPLDSPTGLRPHRDPQLVSFYARFAQACAALLGLLGILVLAGWAFDNAWLKSGIPGLVSMKPNAAMNFLLIGAALGLATTVPGRASRWATRICAGGVLLVAGATAFEYGLGRDFGIDQLLFRESGPAAFTSFPGRMGITTALGHLVVGLGLLLLDAGKRAGQHSLEIFALLAGGFAWIGIVDYVYSTALLSQSRLPWSGMALHTSLAMLLASVGLLCARPTKGIMGTLSGVSPGGAMARRLMVAVVVVPIALDVLVIGARRFGIYESGSTHAVQTFLVVIVMQLVVLHTSRRLDRIDAERLQVIDQLSEALSSIKQLKGLLPICAYCKKIRDDDGYWGQLEQYIASHSDATFSHGICPDCKVKVLEELAKEGILKPRSGDGPA